MGHSCPALLLYNGGIYLLYNNRYARITLQRDENMSLMRYAAGRESCILACFTGEGDVAVCVEALQISLMEDEKPHELFSPPLLLNASEWRLV